jgi:hypothetical protein
MDTSVDDDLHTGRPSSTNKANVEHVREIFRSDRRKSVDQTASEVGISVGSCHSTRVFFNVLNICCMCQHLVPQMPTSQQKETWVDASGDLINMTITGGNNSLFRRSKIIF